MRSKLVLVCLLTALVLPMAAGCTYWRYGSRPELWGMGLLETWEYDSMRQSGMTHWEARRIIRERRAEEAEPEA